MKKFLKVLLVLLSIILIKLLTTYILNEMVISKYEKGKYDSDLIKVLKNTNTHETYIVYYNEGNMFYQKGKYSKAITNYETALEKHPPIKKKCDIRINLSIALIQNINAKEKDEILKKLQEARENLYKDHCADPEDNSGESQDAETLEEAIKEMEEKVEQADGQGDNNNNNQEGQKEEESEKEKSVEKELQEINKQANASRQSQMDDYKNLSEYQYYSGKSW